jgi:hypothetical protein
MIFDLCRYDAKMKNRFSSRNGFLIFLPTLRRRPFSMAVAVEPVPQAFLSESGSEKPWGPIHDLEMEKNCRASGEIGG